MRYEFVEKPVDLDRESAAEFHLTWQGLPVKPRSGLYRRIHIDDALWTTDVKNQPFHITPVYTEGWNRHWNYHNFWNRQVFEEGVHREGQGKHPIRLAARPQDILHVHERCHV